MKVTIETIENGWIVTYPNPMAEGNIKEAFSFDEHADREVILKKLVDLLWFVRSEITYNFGEYNKHEKLNIDICLKEEE